MLSSSAIDHAARHPVSVTEKNSRSVRISCR